jgi:threonine/homoserine/homoserine lactone efflux protein
MSMGMVAAFWATSFVLVLTPGADWAYVIGSALRHRSVVPAVTGLLCGYLLLTAAVAAGLAVTVARSPVALVTLTVLGALYLVWLGATTIARPAALAADDGPDSSPLRQAVRGAGISGCNPKALLLFLALLPQFTDRASTLAVPAQMAVLGLVHIASCAAVYSGVGLGARAILRARPSLAVALGRWSGVILVVIGTALLAHEALR